jgi:L-rhamnose isomerase
MQKNSREKVETAYSLALDSYNAIGVDVPRALSALEKFPLSLQCWQGDDVTGFEPKATIASSGGIQSTGNYPGRATTPEELRADLDKALSFIPGKHRLNLHSIYAETKGKTVERDRLGPEHFQGWIDWAKDRKMGIDFNPTFFSHPKADTGFTLSSKDKKVRDFWVRHGIACREISEHIGKELGSPCIMNIWIPDGFKDVPVDRKSPRERLKKSLDEILKAPMDTRYVKESLESKLFGLGSEACVIGSHEFYLGYALANKKMICFDTGHYHPTEVVSDKISSTLEFVDELLLHISRPVRWDSDHIVVFDDELKAICQEIVRGGYLGRVHIGMDFFDASVNRIAAWVIGARNILKGLCYALLEPTDRMRKMEDAGDYTARLVMQEKLKSMPFGAIWSHYCQEHGVPEVGGWFEELRTYERKVQLKRR